MPFSLPPPSSVPPSSPDIGAAVGVAEGGAVEVVSSTLRWYGLGAAISLWLIYWLTSTVQGQIADIHRELKNHITVSSFYSHQMCINTAHLAGTDPQLCESPKGDDSK